MLIDFTPQEIQVLRSLVLSESERANDSKWPVAFRETLAIKLHAALESIGQRLRSPLQ